MKKIGFLSLALVIALGGLGVGYAAWTDEVTINGTVSTGEVCASFDCGWTVLDNNDPSPPYTIEQGADDDSLDWNVLTGHYGPGFPGWVVQRDKNVGWTTYDCGQVEPPRHKVTLTYHNIYPSYFQAIGLRVRNCGTLPVKLDHVTFTDQWGRSQTIDEVGYLVFDLSGNGVPDFEIEWGDNFGLQAEPNEYFSIDFATHFLQDEDIDFTQFHTYTLTVEIVVVQWNEHPLPLPPP